MQARIPEAVRLKQILRFGIVGGSCFLISWSLLWVGTELLALPYLVSTAAAFAAVALFGHGGNRTYTFKAGDQAYLSQLGRYVTLTLISLALSLLLMWLLVEMARVHYLVANVCVAILMAALNFIVSRIWVFGCPQVRNG
jgi:putative flippase GtrA